MFLSLALIFIIGLLGGFLFEKIRLPKIIFYLILGILLGPSMFNIIDQQLLDISSYLRQIALVIILTRSGLSLNIKTLKEVGRPAFFMCFIPASFEIIGITIFAPLVININIFEALLLGSVLAAVSPAIVVPRMIELKNKGLGARHNVAELIMAGSSCDDIFVIVLFYSFLSLNQNNTFSPLTLLQIPSSIILGIVLGILTGWIYSLIIKKTNLNTIHYVIFLIGISFLLIALENILKSYVSISALLGIIVLSIIIKQKNNDKAIKIEESYNKLWNAFEILLFTLVGAITNAKLAFSIEGLKILGIIIIALGFRAIGVIISLFKTKYTLKEKIYIIISYLPKATVQASIGGIALSYNLPCGAIILTSAVIAILFTAPLGAILMDNLKTKLLKQE